MKIGLTIGDQSGIGLEIIKKSIPLFSDVEFQIIGKVIPKELISYGQVSPTCGRLAGEAIKEAIDLALKGEIDAVVTAPIHKGAFNLGGWKYAGHTEMFADLTNTSNYAMMLIHHNLRVIHVTTHCSLRQALDLITTDRVYETIKIAHNACRQLGIDKPRIAVAGLNPHCGEEGTFGNEEKEILLPAIKMAKEENILVSDSIPADVVFAKGLGGAYDCVVAMYHDQGHIPVKTVGFKWEKEEWGEIDGVNATFGLPIIRTSPDHGVAFGKAGKGTADPTSMISAIKIAIQLVESRDAEKDGKCS
uniref:Putative pyridoxal phosphate biosynthetic protein n=1 Tax=viral metagenome TaxID=1070528 RepID=A0A6M3LNP6_9ZZZZ